MLAPLLLWTLLLPLQAADPLEKYRVSAVQEWEDEIQELEELDRKQTDPAQGVLFIGSSSIRMWDDIATDMAPYSTIRRGYGGAKFSDVAVYIDRLLAQHTPSAIVLFAANDISGGDHDKQPQEVLRLVEITVGKIQQLKPGVPIFLIAVTPTPSRFKVWEPIKQVNALIAEYCHDTEGVFYIDTASSYLDAQGEPIEDYFIADRLHQNRTGYQLWSRIIKAALQPVLQSR